MPPWDRGRPARWHHVASEKAGEPPAVPAGRDFLLRAARPASDSSSDRPETMDRRTADAYERYSAAWIARRAPTAIEDGRLPAFLRRVPRGGRVVDLGCGPGWYAAAIGASGRAAVAVDASSAMLAEAARRAPAAALLLAELEALPFARGCLDAAWAVNCYCHVPAAALPLALADLHAVLRPGAPLELTLPRLDRLNPRPREAQRGEAQRRFDDDKLVGRLFTGVNAMRARALLHGAGFASIRLRPIADAFWLRLTARRARTLPDFVRPGLRLLICGLNPSLYSADAGIPFARPGNRFWTAALAAGIAERPRDVRDALRRGVGFTDLVKRATAGAAELDAREYAAGLQRVTELVRLYRPAGVCFVGLDGWRAAVDRRARPGWLDEGIGGVPAYLMPSTSGRNARVGAAALAAHLRVALGDRSRR